MKLHDGEALKRVLVLGGGGLLGTSLAPVLRQARLEVAAPRSDECDLRDLDALRRRVRDVGADLVINAAAESSVDRAEADPQRAYAVNAAGAHNAALAAAEADVPLVQVSTDYVFDGQRREPYREHHPTGDPVNEYGRSKLMGELLVRRTWPRHFIVRVAALFGPGRAGFVDWVLDRASRDRPLTIVADRFTTPTYTVDLARQLVALVRTPFYGTYHASGHGVASWFELARQALLLAGRDPAGVVPASDADLRSPVRRPPYSALDNHLLRVRGLDTMMSWREGLALYLAQRRGSLEKTEEKSP